MSLIALARAVKVKSLIITDGQWVCRWASYKSRQICSVDFQVDRWRLRMWPVRVPSITMLTCQFKNPSLAVDSFVVADWFSDLVEMSADEDKTARRHARSTRDLEFRSLAFWVSPTLATRCSPDKNSFTETEREREAGTYTASQLTEGGRG